PFPVLFRLTLQPTFTLFPYTTLFRSNGKVLVAGGIGNSGVLASAELYDPASGTWTANGSLSTARYVHTATLLPNGKVLVAGGIRSEEHTSELQSRGHLVCRLLLEKNT